MKVVCVIPAFNEEKTIRKVLGKALPYVDNVVVVDDGSTDRTYERIAGTEALVIRHKKNYGMGRALRTGIEKAMNLGANLIVTLDADGEHDADDIPKLVQTAVDKTKDIVIGSRFLGQCGAYHMPMLKLLSNRISNLLLGILLRAQITDSQCGLRVYSRRVFETVRCEENGMLFATEVLIKSIRSGLTIFEVPVVSVSNGSRMGNHDLREVFTYLLFLMRGNRHR